MEIDAKVLYEVALNNALEKEKKLKNVILNGILRKN